MPAKTKLMSKLVLLQMVMDGISINTIQFYALAEQKLIRGASCASMAQDAFITSQAAHRHVAQLEAKGYVERVGYRKWKKVDNEKVMRDADIRQIARVMVAYA